MCPKSSIACLAFGAALVYAGCAREAADKPYVARVDDAILTMEQVREQAGSDTARATQEYVSAWVTAEMLYQEARRRGLADADQVLKQLEDAKRQLAINALLEHEVYGNDTAAISEEMLLKEFEAERETYRLREDIVNISFVIFNERDAANTFRSKLLRGATWPQALDDVNAEIPDAMLRSASHAFFTQGTLYPTELWKAARALRKEDVSYAIRSEAGYCVMIVHSVKTQGDIPDLEFVRDEIRSRMMMQQRRKKYNELIARLRSQHNVEVRLSSEGGTSAKEEGG